MAIGDPWDTSYNPKNPLIKNQRTGERVWLPDASDSARQDDPLTIKGRRGGRFCKEGCGCKNTGSSNLAGAECLLPPELAVTIIRDSSGRYQARAGIEGGAGEVFHLKYSKGAWRGSRCCSHDARGPLDYACDPCKVTTLPNGKPSECHYANNKYTELNANNQVLDNFPTRVDYNYDEALDGENWPRRGIDAYLQPKGYNQRLSSQGTDMMNEAVRENPTPVCWGKDGVPKWSIGNESDCIDVGGIWSENDPQWSNNGVIDEDGQKLSSLIGTSIEQTQHSSNHRTSLINIKARERRIYLDSEGYYSDSSTSPTGANNRESSCIEDGAEPIKKKPWCRHPLDATKIEPYCTRKKDANNNDINDQQTCEANNGRWLLDEESECNTRGLCYSPDKDEPTLIDQLIDQQCLKRPTTSAGQPTASTIDSQYSCDISGQHDWAFDTAENCVLYHGETNYSGCYKNFGQDWDGSIPTEEECIATAGNVWKHSNIFISYDHINWEYERQSCCGQTLLDEFHPFHTPQMSGGAANTRKNTVCMTPYSEVVLIPSTVTGTVAPQAASDGFAKSIGNQNDRVQFFLDFNSFWTLVIRPCNFWGACLEEGVPRPDPIDVQGQTDNYYDTTCGEEVVLFLPVDQFMNCSNFNLTLENEQQLRSGWKESEPMWHSQMGDVMGNPAQAIWDKQGFSGAIWGGNTQGAFPGDAINALQHKDWCDYPDVNDDGDPDKGGCTKFHYFNSNGGSFLGELQNAKGADVLYGFNIQPQPFKATEEKQNRAKPWYQAANDRMYWQKCVDHVLGNLNGGGNWFWNYGPDYFMYFDFMRYDEMVTTGSGGPANIGVKSGGLCEEVAQKAFDYVEEKDGFLRRGDCGYGNGPLWVGWVPEDSWMLKCKHCEGTSEGDCGSKMPDGSADTTGCCQYYKSCSRQVVDNCLDVIENNATPVYRDAKDEGECEAPLFDENTGLCGADGEWSEYCGFDEVKLRRSQECQQVGFVPEEFVDIVLGTPQGTCQITGSPPFGPVSEKECKDQDGSWTLQTVGSSDSSYPMRSLEVNGKPIVRPRVAGPMTTGLVDISPIKEGKVDRSATAHNRSSVFDRNALGAVGNPVGDSMHYWHQTGLWPRGEMASYVNDQCMGIKHHRRVEYASNTRPIKITTRNHLLQDGDLVSTYGINGNFSANVMTVREWQETQWEDKIYSPCSGENCDEITHPSAVCPYESKCVGNPAAKDKLTCMHGSCSSKRKDGTVCDKKSDCEADADICKQQDSNGGCPSGYTADPEKAPGEECGCVKDSADGPPGCGGTWEGGDGVWEQTCDYSKYYACYGEIIQGEMPPPADFFVAKNITLDTFDIYTCDKKPVDGRINSKVNIDTEQCDDDASQMVCATNAELGYGFGAALAPNLVDWEMRKDPANQGVPAVQKRKREWCTVTAENEEYPVGSTLTQGEGIKSTNLITGEEVTNAPVDSDHTCGGTQPNGGKACESADCPAILNGVAIAGVWGNFYNLADNPLTSVNETEFYCSIFGSCLPVQGYKTNKLAFMTKEDCDEISKVFYNYDPDNDLEHKNQVYVNRCQDKNGNLDNDLDIHGAGDTEAQKAECEKRGVCVDQNGDEHNYLKNKTECENNGFTWEGGTFIEGRYNECVDLNSDDPFKNCWNAASFISEETLFQNSGGLTNWKTCPFTGEWDFWNNNEDVGVEAGYVGHLPNENIDSLYRFGFGGPGFKWEERANDYYVQIEQKGICPVCCDHFMPEDLVATITGMPSELLDYIGCGMDPCDAPTADDSQGFNSAKKKRYDGYCCSDSFHPCDLTGVHECEDEYEKLQTNQVTDVTFGTCKKNGKTLALTIRKAECLKQGGTFSPLQHNGGSECQMFFRKKITVLGHTNCRKCSEVLSSQNKIPTYDQTGNKRGPFGEDGPACCSVYCEALSNDQMNYAGNNDFPTCQDAKDILPPCTFNNLGQQYTIGNLKATCKDFSAKVGGTAAYFYAFDPCSCYPNRVSLEYEGETVSDYGNDSCALEGGNGNEEYDNSANTTGCPAIKITTDADASCLDYGNAPTPVQETCPGLGSVDVPMKYDGVVWRSEWTLMNDVGLKQCELGLHRFKWEPQCIPTGPVPLPQGHTYQIGATELVAVNADCDACDMPQYSGIGGGVLLTGIDAPRTFITRGAKDPTPARDGHFIRLVMGCEGAISSISAYNTGDLSEGGFRTIGPANYRNNGIDIWAEITNCVYTDFDGSEGLKIGRIETGIAGQPPCDGIVGCTSKGKIAGYGFEDTGVPTLLERRYAFAGRCISKTECGPVSPCVDAGCCTYTGRDVPNRSGSIGGKLFPAPIWSGGVACSTGGDISHICNTFGFDPLPKKPAEQFSVEYVKDVDPVTGEGTLVVQAYPPTFGGVHCQYEAGSPVGIGLAELQDAETDTLDSYQRNNMPRNPYLPAGGTVLLNDIPRGDNLADANGDRGRGAGQYMEIRVGDVSKLLSKNPRKNRHLKIFDRTNYDSSGNLINATEFDDMRMMQRLDLAQPYGLKPWPVDHQIHSSTGDQTMFPRGKNMSPMNTESLRKDPTGSITQPGRIGPLPTVDNLNRMFEFDEVQTGDTTTPIPKIMPVEPVMINEFENVYSDQYHCTSGKYKTETACLGAGHLWIPYFSHTEVTTEYDHDLSDAEKVVISGSVVYPATCKGVRMGYCADSPIGNNVSGLDINECTTEGTCQDRLTNASLFDSSGNPITKKGDCHPGNNSLTPYGEVVFTPNGTWVQLYEDTGDPESALGMDGDQYLCETIFGGEWVIGKRNDTQDGAGLYKDPLNATPLAITADGGVGGTENFFVEGCPVGCRLNGFYTQHACDPPSDGNPEGQCHECVEITYKDSEGKEQREMRCPLGPADGNYVVRTRGCQNAEYTTQQDCEDNGWLWWTPVTAKTKFALHDELELFVHDASKLRSNLSSNKATPRFGDGSDWEYDLSQKEKQVTTDAGFAGQHKAVTSITDKDECNSIRDAHWSEHFGECVDLTTMDKNPILEQYFDNYTPNFSAGSLEVAQLCDISDSCQTIRRFKECRDVSADQPGTCVYLVDGVIVEKSVIQSDCEVDGVFIGPVTSHTKSECAEVAQKFGSTIDTQIINAFRCFDDAGNQITARVPEECTELLKGNIKYLGEVVANSKDENKLNLVTKYEDFASLSSPEAITMGHEVGIGLAPRNFKGVIYAPQAENEKYNKYADPNWRAVWSRHGGSFDILIGYPPPVNNCRQANSDKPVNMDFYLNFPSICCNDKGPVSYYQCPHKCFNHYEGPHLEDLELVFGIQGDALMHVNIHE